MLEETATVIRSTDTHAELMVERKSSCSQCQVKSGCGTAVFSETLGKKNSQFTVDNTLSLKVGDQVIVGLDERVVLAGSLMVYLLPVLMMIIFSLIGNWLSDGKEAVVILFALLGVFAAMLLVRRHTANEKAKARFQPVLIRKLN